MRGTTDLYIIQQFNESDSLNVTSSFANTLGLGGPILGLLYVLVLVGLGIAIYDPDKYRRLAQAIEAFSQSLHYTVMGVVTILVVGALVAPAYFIVTMGQGTREAIGMAIAVAVAGYVLLTVIGYVGDRVMRHLRNKNPELDQTLDDLMEREFDTDD